MGENGRINFADFLASRVNALYREALLLTGSERQAETVLEESLIRTGLRWREARLSDPESHARELMRRLASTSTLDTPAEIVALAGAPTTQAPRDLAERVRHGIAARRRRGRKPGLAVAAGLVLAIGVSQMLGGGSTPESASPVAIPSSRPQVTAPSAPSAPQSLGRFVDRANAVRLPMTVADGLYFRAEALGPKGTIIGGTGLDYGAYRASDGMVWILGPQADRHLALTRPPPRFPWTHVLGVTVAAWAQDTGEGLELFCADPNARFPVARQVSTTGIGSADRPVHADADVVAWVDNSLAVQWVRGCGGTPKHAAVPNLLGLSYPELFYTEGERIRAFNLESGLSSEVGVLADAPERVRATFAGSSTHVAWALDGVLFVLDRRDGAVHQVPLAGLPPVGGYGRVTIGGRLVTFAQRYHETDLEYGFVHDVVTGLGVTMSSMVFASRDRLMWREGTSYVVAPVLPS